MKLATPSAGALRRWLCAIALIVPMSHALAEVFSVTSGLSAHWFNPERSGEGLVLEILSDDTALVYWFTYDEEGNQRWLIDVGTIDGNRIEFPALTETRGGRFGPDFDPDEVEQEVVGDATLQFDSCNSGQWSFEAYGQGISYEVVPLTETMAANCFSPNGRPGRPIRDYAGHSGSWYDPSHAGEGYTLQWMSRDQAALVWFSYDPAGDQYWMIGVGTREDDLLVFPSLQTTTGGRFGDQFNSADVEATEWGSLVLELDCGDGSASYESVLPEFGSGDFALSRLTFIHELDCPWEPPKFSDLYTVSHEEIPLSGGGMTNNVRPQDISNQGEVVSSEYVHEGVRIWIWRPGDAALRQLPGLRGNSSALIRPDGLEIVAHDFASPAPDDLPGALPVIWDGKEWSEWPGLKESNSLLTGYSQSGSHFVGRTNIYVEGEITSRAWRSDKDGNQEVILPVSKGIRSSSGEAISNDGEIVVGDQIASDGTQSFRYTTLWRSGDNPIVLRDSTGAPLSFPAGCNHDCSVVAGAVQGGTFDVNHPNFGQAWLWVNGVGVSYLPRIDGAIEGAGLPPYVVQDITEDGSMVIGRFLKDIGGSLGSRVFIWTQSMGMITAEELFQTAGLDDGSWFSMNNLALSPNGRFLLVSGTRLGSVQNPEGAAKAIIFSLIERR
ncbi:MAG: hypothetical protein GVY11_08350 [Gammaproteobacteria bacterium]|jgi:uncharacterized membrane protein|nr:hypothetical protein [Gammaproteobacteria bacterium]